MLRQMDNVLPAQALGGAAPSTSFDAVLRAAVRWASRRRRLTKDERSLVDAVRIVTGNHGQLILEAENLVDLGDRLDQVVEDRAFHLANALIMSLVAKAPRILEDVAGADYDDTEVFGDGQAALLERVGRLMRATAAAARRLFSAEDIGEAAAEYTIQREPLAFLYEWELPAPVSSAILDGMYSTACSIAAARASEVGARLEPWLARGLLERWCGGLYGYLRLLASAPGSGVPKRIVPLEDRVDVELEAWRHKALMAGLKVAAIQSAETGEAVPVFPSAADSGARR